MSTAAPPRSRTARVARVVVAGSLVATSLTGLAVGVFFPWFQLFGDSADRGDHLAAAGAYAAGAVLLGMGVLAARRVRLGAAWAGFAAGAAGFLVMASLMSVGRAGSAADAGPFTGNDWSDGVLAVLSPPWAWVLVVAALLPRRWLGDR